MPTPPFVYQDPLPLGEDQTEYRLLTSISHTSHPVGWEELSARRQDVIDKAVAMLQENYQYT